MPHFGSNNFGYRYHLEASTANVDAVSKRQSAPAKSLPGAEPWGSMALMAISAQPLEKVNFGGNGAATPVRGWMIQTPEVGVPNVLEQAASLMHLARGRFLAFSGRTILVFRRA